jgi:hypothetical protein
MPITASLLREKESIMAWFASPHSLENPHPQARARRRRLHMAVAAGALLTSCMTLLPVTAVAQEQRLDLLGDPVATASGRPVRIDAGTRYVTVEGGETIRFESNGQQFSWSFSGPLSVTSFNLRRVAPAGMLDHDVFVYIRPNPNYFGPD